ncbi:Glycosyltransferase, family GT2 [Tenacibaculum maritimum]|uniref:glycosyltransferase n=1 Tax=Tenacibaculum maritimum TaxID=107401 RepID=UPI0012E43338|nr:glycosyltransferase [Tenacibaculum maritimum]CAA0204554.1 Glycosyltransferase, family GT2 [Tenacibaculum maritimum]
MNIKIDISATIVLYKEDPIILKKTIDNFLAIPLTKKLFLVDNSPTNSLASIIKHADVEYIFIGKNRGFGVGHNNVIAKIKNLSNYHLVLNPDVSFTPLVLPNLINQLKKDHSLAMIAPKAVFPNNTHQYSCRRYPSPLELLMRRFGWFSSIIDKGEYRDKDLTKPFYSEYIAGCFHLYNTSDFIQLRGFDERYFLYMEDVDICRKIDLLGKKKLYYPKEKIFHILKKGSSKNIKLLYYHIVSAIKYFNKWRTF